MQKVGEFSRKVFTELDGRAFSNRKSLEKAVCAAFNKYLADAPPGYTYRNSIELGEQNLWIVAAGKRGYAVFFDGKVKIA